MVVPLQVLLGNVCRQAQTQQQPNLSPTQGIRHGAGRQAKKGQVRKGQVGMGEVALSEPKVNMSVVNGQVESNAQVGMLGVTEIGQRGRGNQVGNPVQVIMGWVGAVGWEGGGGRWGQGSGNRTGANVGHHCKGAGKGRHGR